MTCPHIWSSDEGTKGCELASVTAKRWQEARHALEVAESTLASFYRILHQQGHTNMTDGPDNWVLQIIRDALNDSNDEKTP